MVFKKGNIPWNVGILCPEDIKQEISNTLKNNISLERRKEMSEIEKGERNHFYGKHHSEESKLKMSQARKGKNHPNYGKHHSEETRLRIGEAQRGTKNHMYGKRLSNEHKRKISETLKKGMSVEKRKRMSEVERGEKNHFWKGGIVSLTRQIRGNFKYRQWTSDIFHRDDFTCQDCGQIGYKLNAHHKVTFASILQYYEITTIEEALECAELWNLNNGITLCEECHKKLHCIIN